MTTDAEILYGVQQSVDLIERCVQGGRTVYGVTTGFGGSADTRTTQLQNLQISLQQHLNVGILLPSDKGIRHSISEGASLDGLRSHAMPVPLVKAMMLIRCNSLLRGHSGVRINVIDSILTLVAKDLTPVVPLRGSISASGDLSPLSYIAGLLEGNPNIYVRTGCPNHVIYMTADKALELAGLEPVTLQAKEGLGIVNGTAASCAAAAIAIHQANQIAVLSQVLTAMCTEALGGTAHNYHPFISSARPHHGQKEAAKIILSLLSDSKLVADRDPEKIGLAQDRYALRTAPQWIGPQLEDLTLAYHQIQCEINSTTDNPLLDVSSGTIHHGGNFQAASITSAMEKTMTAIQMLGKLIHAQCSEMLNCMLSKGLPPNLSADDPSTSFTFKGFDVNMSAYMSELAYLAHPVSSHVQSAEMHNQSVNSLALVAARYTNEAIEVVSLMAATYIYALCQALDLRCLHLEFVSSAESLARNILRETCGSMISKAAFEDFHTELWKILLEKWTANSKLDLADRGVTTATDAVGSLLDLLTLHRPDHPYQLPADALILTQEYKRRIGVALSEAYDNAREAYFVYQTAPTYLCSISRILYSYVRKDLGVPMHRGLIDHPTLSNLGGNCCSAAAKKTIGSLASDIYVSLRNGQLYDRVMEALKDIE